jgi:hypothetical protein
MRRALVILTSALAIASLTGCGNAPAGETPAQKTEKVLFAQMDTMGYTNITVTTEIEDEGSKTSPKSLLKMGGSRTLSRPYAHLAFIQHIRLCYNFP